MQIAAITYVCDQNEPSSPFPLELPIAGVCGRGDVEAALGEYLKANADNDPEYPLEILRYEWAGGFGDVQVELEGGTYGEYLIVGFEPADRKMLGL